MIGFRVISWFLSPASRAFPAHYRARSLAALPLAAIFKIHRKISGLCSSITEVQTCIVQTQGGVYVNLVNWWEEVGGKESRVSQLQDVEVSRPHAELNVYFSLWLWFEFEPALLPRSDST